jgi:restriction endonuclease Mrr
VKEDNIMHAVIRQYSGNGAKELIDLLEKRKDEVKGLITGIKGFVNYTLIRTSDGGYTVSVYQDKAGADESVQKAKDWIQQNASNTGVSPPKISEGSVVLHA